LGEHDTAQLASADKPETQQEKIKSEEQEGAEEVSADEQAHQDLEQINQVQQKVLEQLQVIQAEIKANLDEAEQQPSAPPLPKPSAAYNLKVISAESKVKIKQKALQRQKKAEQEA